MKAAFPASRSVAVAGKDRAAVMMGGHSLDQRWYWDGKTYATDLKGVAVPRALTGVELAASCRVEPRALTSTSPLETSSAVVNPVSPHPNSSATATSAG